MKRLLDIFLSLFLLIVFLIPILLICFIVFITSKGPIIYWSDRIGKDNEIFRMPKFRTMFINTPVVATHLLKDPQNFLTPIGSFLRKSSLDELPQLVSVLKGDMSFVGPRPALFNQVDLIELRTSYGIQRLKPGITGWAQINGRDSISIEKKTSLDLEYLVNHSFLMDIKILWLTFILVLKKDNVSH
jgi:O-antigen biosynthesis protein WbqP